MSTLTSYENGSLGSSLTARNSGSLGVLSGASLLDSYNSGSLGKGVACGCGSYYSSVRGFSTTKEKATAIGGGLAALIGVFLALNKKTRIPGAVLALGGAGAVAYGQLAKSASPVTTTA